VGRDARSVPEQVCAVHQLDEPTFTSPTDGTTVITGPVVDQAAPHG
jgi:hypothetical protein